MPTSILAASLEAATEIFESDLIPTGPARNVPWRGHELLRVAMLWAAVRDLDTRPEGSAAKRRRQARVWWAAASWVFGEDALPWEFSFTAICETLGIEPEYMRRALLARMARGERLEGRPGERQQGRPPCVASAPAVQRRAA